MQMTLSSHPEASDAGAFEPTIGEQIRLDRFLEGVKSSGRDELLDAVQMLAKHYYVTHPAVCRWLSREAARNLVGS